jgi:hypothetical protein
MVVAIIAELLVLQGSVTTIDLVKRSGKNNSAPQSKLTEEWDDDGSWEAQGYYHLDDPYFSGSSVESPAPGIDVYSHVCLKENPWEFFSYGDQIRSTARIVERGWGEILAKPTNKSISDWYLDSSEQNCTYIQEQTFFFMDMFGPNPAHCLSDTMFSLIYQQKFSTFSSYAYGSFWPQQDKFMKNCSPKQSWCCNLMKKSGWIPRLPPVYPDPNKGSPVMCFDKLVVTHLTEWRYNPDPVRVKELHDRVTRRSSLVEASWEEEDDEEDAEFTPIFLYDRHGRSRRVYENSDELVDYLLANYKTTIYRIGPEWDEMTPSAQAEIFNAQSHIVTPHGAHLANLIFARPGTKLVEIQCEIDEKAPKQIRSSRPAENAIGGDRNQDPEWYGIPPKHEFFNWFLSFSQILDIQHFVFVEKDGCITDEKGGMEAISPPAFRVEPSEFGEYIARRFNLKRRT